MKKKRENDVSGFRRGIQKFLLIMKLTSFLIVVLTMTVSAGVYSQNTKLDLSVENASIEQALLEIENHSRFIFIYESGTIDKSLKRSISVKGQSIDAVLSQLLEGTDVNYSIDDRQVLLYKKGSLLNTINSLETYSLQQQQSRTITGSVTDASGAPLPGVTVIIKGKTTGTITDANGKYSLANVPADATLAFSFVGMKPQEVKVAGKSTINIVMAEETTAIDEVVAIGYGTVKKKDLSGAVGTIKTEQLDGSVNFNLSNAMQGKIAGVSIASGGGAPGSNPVIKIRGAGSLNNTDPLILVDDVPVTDMSILNPNDIESLQVLKDASAAAIYGSRAANGVILITTKTGKAGAVKINATADYGVQSIKQMALTNADEWLTVIKQMYTADNVPLTQMPAIAQNPMVTGTGTNWQDEVYHVAPLQTYYVGASGGGENLTYNASIGYLNQDGVGKNIRLRPFEPAHEKRFYQRPF